MKWIIFALVVIGSWLILSAVLPGIYRPAALALRNRSPTAITQTEMLISKLSALILPYIDIEPIKRGRLAETLKSLGHTETPEQWQAHTFARAGIFAPAFLPLLFVSPFFAVAGAGLTVVALYQQQSKKLTAEMDRRRQSIERELPQFASTIRQSLNNTHDVVSILTTYRKICSPALQSEITRTLNDMLTGNPERAIKALESRVASPKLGQITRGLIGVLRGDDQRFYFEMLSAEFRKAQNEEVSKELLQRPGKLAPYMGLLFACLCFMIAASLGAYMLNQMTLFS